MTVKPCSSLFGLILGSFPPSLVYELFKQHLDLNCLTQREPETQADKNTWS